MAEFTPSPDGVTINLKSKTQFLPNKKEITSNVGETPFINQSEKTVQSDVSKLAENITGFKLDDSRIVDQLIDDHEKIGDKYSLPYITQSINHPDIYYKNLRSLLNHNNIPLYKDSNKDGYFKKNPDTMAAYFPDTKSILINENYFDGESMKNRFLLLATLTHETIHALQDKYDPKLSIEQKEYEAYVGSLPLSSFKEDLKKKTLDVEGIFKGIFQSVEIYNRQINKQPNSN